MDWPIGPFGWMPEGPAAQREKAIGFECRSKKMHNSLFTVNSGRGFLALEYLVSQLEWLHFYRKLDKKLQSFYSMEISDKPIICSQLGIGHHPLSFGIDSTVNRYYF